MIRDGYVTVDGDQVTKTGYKLEQGDIIQIQIPPVEKSTIEAEDIPLDIIFEDDDLIIVNKPAGMVVHPSAGHSRGTLVHAALAHAPQIEGIGGIQRPGIVHRLDKETSGLILLAKNDKSHQWLQEQFRNREVKKIYRVVVESHPPTPKGRIEAPIGRDPSHRKQMAVVPIGKGREAITEYYSVERFELHSLINAHPLTGRTHQIRLHMAFIGCPVVGDKIYGRKRQILPVDRQLLHAAQLEFRLPNQQTPEKFEAPLPDDMAQILSSLRLSGKHQLLN